jgi:hypothetical protein
MIKESKIKTDWSAKEVENYCFSIFFDPELDSGYEVAISQIFPQNWRQNYQFSKAYANKLLIKLSR